MNILRALEDPAVFGGQFRDPATWAAWHAFLATLFALPLTDEQLTVYRECTGRTTAPAAAFVEAWLVCGRRAGKSFMLALTAIYIAVFRDWRPYLGPGERATVMIIAADRRQARVILRYVLGLLRSVPMLARTIERERAESIDLANKVTIEIHTASFRTTRGYTIVAALCDELAFWAQEDQSEPDYAVLDALRPGMGTVPGAMLLCASSPYARRGALWDAHRRHFGKDGSAILVWQAPTRVMNPTLPQRVVDEATERDPASAAAEYGAQFRTDIESFISREAVMACVTPGVRERPPIAGVHYYAAVDPSGGSSDSMTMAICHRENDVIVIDALRDVKPPFSPEGVVCEFATLLKSYRITMVRGDRYAGEWPREQFRKRNIEYRPADKNKSEAYTDLLPAINSRRIDLLDNDRVIAQLCSLERRTGRAGKDSIDHGPGAHDDLGNAVALVVGSALSRREDPAPLIMSGKVFGSAGNVIADGVSAFFDRLAPKPAPSTAQQLHEASLKAQHEEMRRAVEPHSKPVDWDAAAAAKKAREANRPPPLMFYGKLFGGYR
jgi:Terminase large subunit, T4likevirus-type, N-terminal